jgi:hypothetical protein
MIGIEETMKSIGAPLPGKHPGTGEPFVEMRNLKRETDSQPIEILPIPRPERNVGHYEGDDDDFRFVVDHVRTDEELAEAAAAWEKSPGRHGGFVGMSQG